MTTHETHTNTEITIRRMDLSASDQVALTKLAELDSRTHLEGAVLGAEVEGRLLAAISLADGAVVADPFSPTGELTDLLELRSGQLRERRPKRSRWQRRRPAARRHEPQIALGGSPPGEIISLMRAR